MTTTVPVNDVSNSLLPSSLFNIQYPNCRGGMFSLREPFKNMTRETLPIEQRQTSTRKSAQPTHIDRVPSEQPVKPASVPVPPRQPSKRNAEVQCSLLTPNIRHDMAVQTKINRHQPPPVNYFIDENEVSPRYHHHKIYEIRDIDSPSLQIIPIKHKQPRTKHVKPIIEYDDDDEEESDYDDERIIYPRRARKTIKKTYLPPNVRMMCMRNDANRVSY